jgi:nitroreductase
MLDASLGEPRRTMEIDYLLTATRSVRKLLDLDAPVDADEIRDCLRIGCQAANGTNMQTWRWIVVSDPDVRAEIARLYEASVLTMTGRASVSDGSPPDTPFGRLMSSTEWLVEHLAEVPLHVIPCYEPYLPDRGGSSFWIATLYGSIFPAVWNFQLALHTRGYGTCITTLHLGHEQEISALLGIPETYVQSCLLPVGRLRSGQRFRPAPRRPVGEVVSVDRFDGPPL